MRNLSLSLVVTCAVIVMVSCGGSGNNGGGKNQGNSGISQIIVTCSPTALRSTQTSQCSAQVTGTGNFSSAVTWAAGKGSISNTGVFTAPVVESDTTITITAISVQDSSKQQTTTVTVSNNVDSVSVSCSPATINTGDQSQCTATVVGVGTVSQTVTWYGGLAGGDLCNCVSSSGLVTGPTVPGQGTVYATATSSQNPLVTGWFGVTVNSPGTITGVSVSCAFSEVVLGEDSLCTATVTGTGNFNPAVKWTSAGEGGYLFRNTGLYLTTAVTYIAIEDTIQATSLQDSSKVGSATVTLNPTTGQPNNVVPLTVDAGPPGLSQADYNTPFTTVTVCIPGTNNCQTIDHVLVDTGSTGLRLLAAGPAGGKLSLQLPPDDGSDNASPNYECATFVSGFLWGPIVNADILTLGDRSGEQASNAFIQIVGQPGEAAVPSACQNAGTDASNLQALGANGILGVGSDQFDPCGNACYFTCAKGACVAAGLADLVPQPVSLFAQDNQGVVIQLPSVTPPGATSLSGSMLFGINSQSNNQLDSAQALEGDLSTSYQGVNYEGTIFDTGSDAYAFLNSSILGLNMPYCSGKSGFYCPKSTQTFSVTNSGDIKGSSTVSFSVDNANALFQNQSYTVFPTLGADWPLTPPLFDYGLPFFYGRNVFVALPGAIQGTGLMGPFVAY